LNAPRYANHKTDSDIPPPASFLGSKSVHSQKGLLETVLRDNRNNYQVFLVTLVTLYFLGTLNWYLWYFPTKPSPLP
ncbi:mCG1037753, partial [Mus musculus]